MKKLFALLLTAMLLPMAMNAQLLGNNDIKVQRAPLVLKSFNQRMMAPNRADLGPNQMIMGHYNTDDVVTGGYLGLTNFNTVIPTAIEITPEELALFQGGKIVAFRVGLAQATTISRVFAAPITSDGFGTFTEWTCNTGIEGWNEIPVDPPYEIDLDSNTSLFIGFDYRQTRSNYPISAVDVGTIYPTYMYLTNQGQTGWYNVGLESYGNLSLQCIVEKDDFPEYLINVIGLSVKRFVKQGDEIPFSFSTRNVGTASDNVAAGACTYNVLIDGVVVATISNPEAFGSAFVDINNNVASDGLALGQHTLTIQVNTINGEPVENPSQMSREFTLFENGFDRQMHLVEEFTSNSCMYCPLGASMLKILLNMRDDIALAAIHGNQSEVDPYNTAQCDTLWNYMGPDGWPSAAFNRSTGWEDDDLIASSIGYYEQYHQMAAQELSNFFDELGEAPSFATININSKVDAATNVATVTIDGQVTPDFVDMMGADAKLTVYLTESNLIYKQNNQGTWVNQYQHDHVLRVALGSVLGSALNITGETFKNEYTYTIPSGWNTDNMEVIAFISRPLANGASGVYTDMYINQANQRKLGEFDEPTFIRGDVNSDNSVNIADVTSLINYLLSHDATGLNLDAADCDETSTVNIADVTALINYLLSHSW